MSGDVPSTTLRLSKKKTNRSCRRQKFLKKVKTPFLRTTNTQSFSPSTQLDIWNVNEMSVNPSSVQNTEVRTNDGSNESNLVYTMTNASVVRSWATKQFSVTDIERVGTFCVKTGFCEGSCLCMTEQLAALTLDERCDSSDSSDEEPGPCSLPVPSVHLTQMAFASGPFKIQEGRKNVIRIGLIDKLITDMQVMKQNSN